MSVLVYDYLDAATGSVEEWLEENPADEAEAVLTRLEALASEDKDIFMGAVSDLVDSVLGPPDGQTVEVDLLLRCFCLVVDMVDWKHIRKVRGGL